MTALLFGKPDNLVSRHPGAAIAAVLVLGACAEWLADTGAALIVGAM
jgi:hypothetical protein